MRRLSSFPFSRRSSARRRQGELETTTNQDSPLDRSAHRLELRSEDRKRCSERSLDADFGAPCRGEEASGINMQSEPQQRPLKYCFSVDASYDHKMRIVGIGMVVQRTAKPKKRGPVVNQYSEGYTGVPSGCMEEFAVLRALEVASELGCQYVTVRSDYNQMRKGLKEDLKRNTGHDQQDLHGCILRLAKRFKEVKFAYVPRRKNLGAHRFARKAAQEPTVAAGHRVFEQQGALS